MAVTKDMTVGRPFPLILKFSLPLLLGTVLQQTYSLVDAAIIGKSLDIQSLGAIGSSSSVLFFILGFCNGCCGGFGIPVAQKFGAKDFVMLRSYVNTSIRISIVMSLIIMLLTVLLCRKILVWMSTPDDIFDGAYIYLLITFFTIPAIFMYNLFASVIRALGDSKTPFYFLIVATILNIALDFLFILGFGFGVGGAAFATLVSQLVATVLCGFFMMKKFPVLKKSDGEKKFCWQHAGHLLSVGVPMGLQFSITAIGSMMLQNSNNALGTTSVAAFTTAMRIKMFFTCAFDNMGMAMATFAGQNFGAKKISRIIHGVKDSMIMMLIYTALLFAIIWPFARIFGSWFMDGNEIEVLDKTELFLHVNVIFHITLAVLCILRYTIQGVGFTKLSLFSGVAEMIARILVSCIAVPALGFMDVCLGDPLAWVAADLFLIPAFIYVYKKIKN